MTLPISPEPARPLRECAAPISPQCEKDLYTWKMWPVCKPCQALLDTTTSLPYALLPHSFPRSSLTPSADCPGHYTYEGKPVVFSATI